MRAGAGEKKKHKTRRGGIRTRTSTAKTIKRDTRKEIGKEGRINKNNTWRRTHKRRDKKTGGGKEEKPKQAEM